MKRYMVTVAALLVMVPTVQVTPASVLATLQEKVGMVEKLLIGSQGERGRAAGSRTYRQVVGDALGKNPSSGSSEAGHARPSRILAAARGRLGLYLQKVGGRPGPARFGAGYMKRGGRCADRAARADRYRRTGGQGPCVRCNYY